MQITFVLLFVFLTLQGCKCPATCDDCEGGKILSEIKALESESRQNNSTLSESEKCGYFIEMDDTSFCCDDAETVLEMGLCSRYVIDSLTLQMDSIYQETLLEIESNLQDPEYIDYTYYQKIKKELINSQKIFFKNMDAERTLIEAIHQGRESVVHQNSHDIFLLENRIILLKEVANY